MGWLNRSAWPYIAVGVVLNLLLQLVFWLQLGGARPRVTLTPFLLAYSQKALLDLAVYDPGLPLQASLWMCAYLGVALLLWLVLEVGRKSHAGNWVRAFVSWIAGEGVLAAVAWWLLRAGVLSME